TLAFISLVIGSFIIYSLSSNVYFMTFATFTVMFTYTAIKIILKISPIWQFIPESVYLIAITVLPVIILINNLFHRVAIIILASCLGELFYGLIIIRYVASPYTIDYNFLNNL